MSFIFEAARAIKRRFETASARIFGFQDHLSDKVWNIPDEDGDAAGNTASSSTKNVQDTGSPWQPSSSEEIEFLRMQAIQNQAEMDTLHKRLELCLEEKEKLERHVNDLETKLEERAKIMVDAITAARQREAEAHETAANLSKENDELRMKLKVLIEDNNKLIELYEQATEDCDFRNTGKAQGAEVHQDSPAGLADSKVCCSCSRHSTCKTSKCECKAVQQFCKELCKCLTVRCQNRIA